MTSNFLYCTNSSVTAQRKKTGEKTLDILKIVLVLMFSLTTSLQMGTGPNSRIYKLFRQFFFKAIHLWQFVKTINLWLSHET